MLSSYVNIHANFVGNFLNTMVGFADLKDPTPRPPPPPPPPPPNTPIHKWEGYGAFQILNNEGVEGYIRHNGGRSKMEGGIALIKVILVSQKMLNKTSNLKMAVCKAVY